MLIVSLVRRFRRFADAVPCDRSARMRNEEQGGDDDAESTPKTKTLAVALRGLRFRENSDIKLGCAPAKASIPARLLEQHWRRAVINLLPFCGLELIAVGQAR